MERRQLEYFVAVARLGSLAVAARELRVTQPALSQGIRQLESHLGCELFHRVPRGMQLTAAGRALVEPAGHVLANLAVARAVIADVVGLKNGTIDVATLPGLVMEPLADWIRVFRATAPGVRVNLRQFDTSDEVIAAVRLGEAELGLTISVPPPSVSLVCRRVAAQELVAVLPAGTSVGEDVSVEEIVGFGMVVGGEQLVAEILGFGAAAASGGQLAVSDLVAHTEEATGRRIVAVDVERRESALALILAGVGAGILPRAFGEVAAARGAAVRPLRPPIVRDVHLVWRDAPLTPTCRAFLKVIDVL
ncbi:LysR substrate-binding domain-containing protein [Microbacterium kribbense]|uniref:LysR substrate-binding domain-containing protein n=1 Tax=Microbacterium kribbense TaxID=433645 RepID=A0ABP7GHT7_9MICO